MLSEHLRVDKKIRSFFERHERLVVPGLLVMGFVFDVITFQALDMITTMQILGAYVILAALALVYLQIYDSQRSPSGWALLRYLRALAPYVIQLTYGALLSSSLLFYWYSGALSVSWPLFALITGIMISSEVFRRFYLRPIVLLSVYTFLLLSYLSLLLPFVFRSLSGWIFIISSLISLVFVGLLVVGLAQLNSRLVAGSQAKLVAVLVVIASMNSMYFLNLIPPLPLSIREAGIYHKLERLDNELILSGEDENFWLGLIPGQKITWSESENIYVYTRIFAPAQINMDIYHRWEYYSPITNEWEDADRLRFEIKGGRAEGYRGYTTKNNLAFGKWRVTVETERGQVLGRLAFTLIAR